MVLGAVFKRKGKLEKKNRGRGVFVKTSSTRWRQRHWRHAAVPRRPRHHRAPWPVPPSSSGIRARRALLSLSPLTRSPTPAPSLPLFARHGRDLARARRRVAVDWSRPDQIEARHLHCRVALYLLVQGIDPGSSESTPSSQSPPPPAAAVRARHRRRPTSPRLAVHGFVLLVRCWSSGTSPFSSSLPRSAPSP